MMKEQITVRQLFMLFCVSRGILLLVYLPPAANPDLKRDLWLLASLGLLLLFPFTWVLNRLWQRFPDHTFVQVCEMVLGKPLGKMVAFLYALYILHSIGVNLRLVGEFFNSALLPKTPLVVLIGMVAFMSAWAASAGIEVMGRASQIVFPLLVGTVLLTCILVLKDLKATNLQPIFGGQPSAMFKEMVTVVGRTEELIWIGLAVPFVKERRRLFHTMVVAMVWLGAIWTVIGVAVTGVLGDAQQRVLYPFFAVTRIVSIADFLERIDALLLVAWLLGMFLRIGAQMWAASLVAAQGLGLGEYRPLVVPLPESPSPTRSPWLTASPN